MIEQTELDLDGETLGIGLAITGDDRDLLERARRELGVTPDEIASEALKGGLDRLEEEIGP